MKKLMIIAALGTAALFTACGDDSSSSGPSESCEVSTTENSVKQEITFGETVTTTWTIDGDNITMTQEGGENASEPFTYAKGDQTVESLKADAEKSCEETKKMWEEMGL